MVEIKASVGYMQLDGKMTVDTLVKNTEISSLVVAFDFYSTDATPIHLVSVSYCIPPFGTSGCINVRIANIPFKDPYYVRVRKCISGPNCAANTCVTFSGIIDSSFTGEVVRYDGVIPSQATYKVPSDCIPCQISWSCEEPLSGYEYERCTGQRRRNPACDPVSSISTIFNIYTTPDIPKAGDSIKITTEIANVGYSGKVRAVFKVGGTQISDQNSTLVTFRDPGRVLWSPTVTYTMPNTTITITIEAYGWDGAKWVLTDTKSITRTPSVVSCAGVTLTPFSADVKIGGKVTFTAKVAPSTTQFDVQFKDRAGTVLGTCKTSEGSCAFIWDSTGKTIGGIYHVIAYVPQGDCYSTESVIEVDAAIRQWNFNVAVIDSVTGAAVSGATVSVSTVGGALQSKMTGVSGLVSFRMDEGTINIAISKDGYNAYNTAEYLFIDKSVSYSLAPIPPTPTTGSIQFVSVPIGASIWIDGKDTGKVTLATTVATIDNLKAGDHTWELRLSGYNTSSGVVTVPSGGTVSVYTSMTLLTPTAGSLNITSHPMGATVFINGSDTKRSTPAIITNISPGTHSYVLTMTGFQDKSGTFGINAGQTTYLDVELVPLTTIGTLEIDSGPHGARVFIDGSDTSRSTPATITNLAVGDHTYRLVLSKYEEATGKFTIIAGETKVVNIMLEKTVVPEVPKVAGVEMLAIGVAAVAILALAMRKKESKK